MARVDTKVLKEQNGRRAEQFAKSFERSRRELFAITGVGIKNVDSLIGELQDEVRSRMAFLIPNDPNAPFLLRIVPDLATGIDEAIEEFSRRAKIEINGRMADAFETGSGVTSSALSQAGLDIARPSVSAELLASLSAFSDDILDQAGTTLGRRIANRIRLSAAGLTPASKTITDIANLMRRTKSIRGVSRRIGFAFQAEAIVRTETGRIFSNAQQIASEEISQSIPTLRKKWVTTLRERRGHRDVENATAEGGSIGPIPIKQRFTVKDFSRTGTSRFLTLTRRGAQRVVRTGEVFARRGRVITDRMLFPRDPSASAGNVISCTCISVDVIPELEEAIMRAKGVLA